MKSLKIVRALALMLLLSGTSFKSFSAEAATSALSQPTSAASNPSATSAFVPSAVSSSKLGPLERVPTALQAEHRDSKSLFTELIGPGIGFVAVLLGALIAAGIQFRSLKQTWEIAEKASRIEIEKSIVEWQIQQLSELYGPLHALLQQSRALYRQMNRLLEARDKKQFQLRVDATALDFDGRIFEINTGTWEIFRTVVHLDLVYGKGYGIEDYFDEIVEIGRRMERVIQEKSGYVRAEDADLAQFFGQYLAHFAVLNRMHAERKAAWRKANVQPGFPYPSTWSMAVDPSAAFPREIQKLVHQGFNDIASELRTWQLKAR